MKISELKTGQEKVDIELDVKAVSEPRTFNKYGRDLRVANATVSDGTSEITLSLWNDDINKIKAGDKVKITGGYVSEFNGKKQLTSGKSGKIEVMNGSSDKSDKPKGKLAKKEADEVEF